VLGRLGIFNPNEGESRVRSMHHRTRKLHRQIELMRSVQNQRVSGTRRQLVSETRLLRYLLDE